MNHEAIRKAYPNVQIIDETAGAFDFDENSRTDQSKIDAAEKTLLMKRLLLLIKESVQLNTQQLVTN